MTTNRVEEHVLSPDCPCKPAVENYLSERSPVLNQLHGLNDLLNSLDARLQKVEAICEAMADGARRAMLDAIEAWEVKKSGPEEAMTDKHKQRLLPWLDDFDIGDELRNEIAETLAHPLAEAVAEERERAAKVGFDVLDSFGFGDIGKEVAAKIREGA